MCYYLYSDQANIGVVKTVNNATPLVGSTVIFTIGATNTGPSTATSVTVTDNVPAGYTITGTTVSTGTFSGGVWTIGTLLDGQSETMTITATVNATGPYANTAVISSPVNDPTPGNNTSTSTPVPVPQTDLSVTKAASSNTPDVGSFLTFTIDATNNGPSNATSVVVNDLLPSGYTFVSYTSTAGTYSSVSGNWTIGNLANGVTQSLFIQAAVNPSGVYQNCASISGAQSDPTAGNNNACITPVPVPQTNLGVIKTASPSNPSVGGNVVFLITANNAGPSPATGVQVTDLLPTGYTFVSATPSVGTYTPGTGIWSIPGTLPANGTNPTLSITATVNASGNYSNTACITGAQNDPTPGNNCSTVIPGPTAQADLSITKTANTSNPPVGGTITFTLTASNAGPSDATAINVADLLPAGYTYSSHTTSFGNYNSGTGAWSGFNLTNGATATIQISATVNPNGPYQNCATISGGENDPSSGNNSDCITPTPVPQTDLSILKTVSNATPNVGGTVVFTLAVNNAGPSNATSVTVNDLLPSGYTFISASPSVGTYNAGTGAWTIGSLTNGGNATLAITANVTATSPYQNCASISGAQNDPSTGNNTSCVTPTPVPQTDLSISKTMNTGAPNVGGPIIFTLTASNLGLSDATGVSVTDLLPTGYTFVSASPGGVYNNVTGLWTIGNLLNGTNTILTINATVNATGNYQNCASITGSQNDPASANNTACVTSVPVPQTNLGITKTVNATNPPVGSNVIFTITVNNAGPSNATGVTVTDVLPSGYTFVAATPSVGTFSAPTWTIGNLNNGASAILNIEATVEVSGDYTNCATVTGTQNDPSSSNNTACASPVPSAISNLVVNKSVDNSTPVVGSNVVFTIQATNVGPSDATSVVVNDALPTGYTFVSSTQTVGTYTGGVWTIGSLLNGATETLTITAQVKPSGAYQNCATISGSQTDPNTGNNLSCATITPVPQTDLSIVKTASNMSPLVGSTVTFTLVAENFGPSNATGVLVSDLLPSCYTYVSHTASAGTYNSTNGNWLIGALGNGISRTLTITASVNTTGNCQNCASISGNQIDPISSNNSACVTPVPVSVSNLNIVKTVSPASPLVGSNVTFTITVNNAGPSADANVVVTDALPSGYSNYSASTSNGSFNVGTGIWNIGAMSNGGTAVLTIGATVLPNGTYVNTATVSGNSSDPDTTDNISSVAPTPVPVTDLSITKTINNTTPSVGDTITFTVIATNNGPSFGTGISVNDTIPTGYSIISFNTTNGVYAPSNGTWTIGTLASGSSDTLNVTVVVLYGGSYTNTAVISGSQVDPTTSNNTASATPVLQNLPPVAVNDTISTLEDTPITFLLPITSNDYDVDGFIVPSSIDLDPGQAGTNTATTPQGNWSVDASGYVTFTPALNFNGTATLPYTVLDNSGAVSNIAWIVVIVDPVNDPPVLDNEYLTTLEDTPVSGDLTDAGDFDVDGNLVVNTTPLSGPLITGASIVINPDGTFTYTPASNFVGNDMIVVEICDDGTPLPSICVNDTIFITVTFVNDPPVAVDDDTTTLEDTPITFNILANDYDIDGFLLPQTTDLDTLTPGIQTSVTNSFGTWTLDALGNLTFTPALNFNGVATIYYTVCDTSLLISNSALVTIIVLPMNDAPVIVNEYEVISQGNTIVDSILINDSDVDGNLSVASVVSSPTVPGAVFTFSSNGAYTYTPPSAYIGNDTVIVLVCDDGTPTPIICINDTIFITVIATNPPVAVDDDTTILEDNSITFNITNNDYDSDGYVDSSTVVLGTNNGGTWSVDNLGNVTFTPPLNGNGVYTSTYTVLDNVGVASNVATITITVLPVNDAPVIDNEYIFTTQNNTVGGDLTDTGDFDVDGNLVVNTTPLSGPQVPGATIVINTDGTFTYTPALNYIGQDTIVVEICDDGTPLPSICVNDTIFVSVLPNTAPTANPDNTTTLEDTPITFNITNNDNDPDGTINTNTVDLDPLTAGIQNNITNSSGTWSVAPNGDLTFNPIPDSCGYTATINYVVNDNGGATSNSTTVSVGVICVNDPPVAVNDTSFTWEDTPITLALPITSNDYDIDGFIVTNSIDLDPSQPGTNFASTPEGNWNVDPSGNLTFTPALNFNGTATLLYTVLDNSGAISNQGLIVIVVGPVNDPPVLDNEYLTTLEDTPVSGDLTDAGDYDVDGNLVVNTTPLSGPLVTGATIVINPDGTFTYTPAPNYVGNDMIVVEICDDGTPLPSICVNDTIFITVTFVNDPPVAVDDDTTTLEDTPITFNILANDYDIDGFLLPQTTDLDTLTPGIQTSVTNAFGTWTLDLLGNLTFTPALNFNGVATIYYTVCDTSLLISNSALVTITVLPVNDAPIIVNEYETISQGNTLSDSILINDSDVDGNLSVVSVVSPPTVPGAVFNFSPNGAYTYTPPNSFVGTDTVIVLVCDDGTPLPAICINDTIFITVTPTNPPVAVNDDTTTLEDTPITFNITNNDVDSDGYIDSSTVVLGSNNGGTWSVDNQGNVTFTPPLNGNGVYTSTYTVLDNLGTISNVATITINVLPVNDAPIVDNEYLFTTQNLPVGGDLTDSGDFDVDGNLVVNTTPISGPQIPGATIVINPDGTFTYTPALNYVGNDTVVVEICDDGTPLPAICVNDSIFVTVLPNASPIANPNDTTTLEDTPITFNITNNDIDPDGTINTATVDLDPLTAGIQSSITNSAGTWSVDPNGNLTFTPIPDSCGYTATVNYVVNDNGGATSNSTTVSVGVICVNDPPVATNDSLFVYEDLTLTVDLELLTSDPDGPTDPGSYDLDTLTPGIQSVLVNSDGVWIVDANGVLTFTPTADSCGYNAVLYYTVNDVFGLTSNVGIIVVTVICVNDAPTTGPITVVTPVNTPVPVNVAAGTSDPENNPLTYTYNTSGVASGTIVTITGNGAIVVTPPNGYIGVFTIPFTACDSSQYAVTVLCVTDTIYVNVVDTTGPGNNFPIANNDLVTTPIGTPIVVNPLANDYDVDGDPLTVTVPLGTSTNGGVVTVNPNGTVTYTPPSGFTGTDFVQYVICDPLGACDTAFIIITVSPMVDTTNLAPIAVDDYATTFENVTITVSILNNDSDPNGTPLDPPTILVNGSNGTGVIVNGQLVYTPNFGFIGTDTLIYVICDTAGAPYCDTATVVITVLAVNAPPITQNITVSTSVDVQIGVNVGAGTSDPENNPLTFTYGTPSNSGATYNINGNTGTITVFPPPGFVGTFTIPFVVCDSSVYAPNILCDSGVITVIVVDTSLTANEPPIANNDMVTTLVNTTVIINPLGNDTDPNGDPLTVTVINGVSFNGIPVVVNPNMTVTYIPEPGYVGIDTIEYIICDPFGACDTAFIIITISPELDQPNVSPLATDDYTTTFMNVPVVAYPVMNNDSDPNGNFLNNPSIYVQASNGVGVVNANGTITYTPNAGWYGLDTITYVICDNGTPQLCDTADFIILVILPNSPPSQGNEIVSMSTCDSLINFDVLSNNIDPDGDSVLVSAFTASSVQGGTVVLNTNGTLSYFPPSNFIGLDTVYYTVCDTFVPAGCVNDTIFISVLPDNDCDGIPDPDDIDDDNDGITDIDECATANGPCDTDGDGIPDYFDLDSDNDGIPDIVESGGGQWDLNGDGMIDSNIDTDNDGLMDVADPDNGGIANPNGDFDGDNRPDFQDLDSDNDGISDVTESGGIDANNDGLLDTFTDANGDGMDDNQAKHNPRNTDGNGNPDYIDLDSDNDGISDILESGQPDVDGNGVIDTPADTNNDGLADSSVGTSPQDYDNDSYPDYIDLDSDSDGIPDVVENGYGDLDQNSVVDNYTDLNNNGWNDSSEGTTLLDTDSDLIADYLDLDSDQDGIPDVVEGGHFDIDMNGILDDLTDLNKNGQADFTEGNTISDWDNDGTPDYLDDDSDDDGCLDVTEGGFADENKDGVIDNFTDANNDGWDDKGLGWTVPDTDGDGIFDFRDLDSDNDNILDADECGKDCDNDGVPDNLDADPCLSVLEIPDGFTPNGDGFNDYFVIPGIERFPGNELIVYNRWGNIVYTAKDYNNDWNGTTNSSLTIGSGDQLPTGTYYYLFDTKDANFGVAQGFIYIQR